MTTGSTLREAESWLKNLEGFTQYIIEERKQGRRDDDAQGGRFPPALLALLTALILHKDEGIQKQALTTAACLPKLEPLIGVQLLHVLVFALQETLSGKVSRSAHAASLSFTSFSFLQFDLLPHFQASRRIEPCR